MNSSVMLSVFYSESIALGGLPSCLTFIMIVNMGWRVRYVCVCMCSMMVPPPPRRDFLFLFLTFGAMVGENRRLVTNEPVEFEK